MPHPGKQTLAATCPADEVLFAGTRGGGKSATAIGRQIRGATKYGIDWRGLMARKKYKDLGGLKRGFDELIRRGMPAERIGGENQSNLVRFLSGPAKGAEIILTAFQQVKQLDDWQGFEFCEVTIDEAPQISYIATVIDKMRGTLRSKRDIHTSLFMTGNPGGAGASTLKLLYKLTDQSTWGKVQNVEVRFDLGTEDVVENISRVYIHSVLEDNPSINARDYKKKLAAISDKALLEAWLRGDWNVTIGQAFYIDPSRHVIDPIWPVPEHVPIYMTFDWGYGAPFSVGWWWVDNDNRVYRFGEWYGWDGKNPNRGLRLTDREIAHGILQRERELGIGGRKIDRLAGPDSFRRKPNYLGGGQGPSTADEFNEFAASPTAKAEFGQDISLKMRPGDADREKKLRQFRNRLRIPASKSELPMLVVYSTCSDWIRTIPSIALDEDNIEVIEEGQEDHCLHGDTEVLTGHGVWKIKDLVGTTGYILNQNGEWEVYTKCWKTRTNARTLRLVTETGTITCTPDHQFLTVNGWKEAQYLTFLDLLVKNTVETATGCVDPIFNGTANDFTTRSIKTTGGLFLLGGKFTIRTGTVQIMPRRTWESSPISNTESTTPGRWTTQIGSERCRPEHGNGTVAWKAGSGTKSSGRNTVKVLWTEIVNELNDVYCLNVPGSNSFTLGSGIVSHNCYDESCHICMARPIGADFDSISREAAIVSHAKTIAQLDTASRAAAQELFLLQRQIADQSGRAGSDIILDPRSVGLREDDFDDEFNIDAEDLFRSMPALKHLFS
jgi:hypothetical protein